MIMEPACENDLETSTTFAEEADPHMASIWRYGFTWSGFTGGPGRTVFYGSTGVSTPQVLANDTYSLLHDILNPSGTNANIIPAGVRIAGDTFVDEMEDSTGDQVGRLGITANPDIVGVGSGNWASPAGACITWSTNTFIKGRRLRGRTFLVPLDGVNAFATDGTLNGTLLSGTQAAVTGFLGSLSEPVVWHRPTTKDGVDGSSSAIIAGQMKDKVSVLTSRRD